MTEPARAGSSGEGPLGILACAGPLPIEIAAAAVRSGRPVHIVGFDGFVDSAVAGFPHERVKLGELGRLLGSFQRAGARDIIIAGAMQRPNMWQLKIDTGFVRHLPSVIALTRGGDDSVLRKIVRFFEQQGFRVVGVADVAPGLLARDGAWGQVVPGDDESRALARAARLIAALGAFDIGQAVVATAEEIVGVEGVRGTDALLRDLGPEGYGAGLATGGVLVKLAKPGQELRVDLPTIGVETVRRVRAAGLRGIGVDRGRTIVLDRVAAIAEADQHGHFLFGLDSAAFRGVSPAHHLPALSTRSAATSLSVLAVEARRAPTPAERRDIEIGRQVLAVLHAHGGGPATVVAHEHVQAVAGKLPLVPWLSSQERSNAWGRRAFRSQIGTLVIAAPLAGASAGADAPRAPLTMDLFRAAQRAALAGIAWLGPRPPADALKQMIGWANDAKMFLMMEPPRI